MSFRRISFLFVLFVGACNQGTSFVEPKEGAPCTTLGESVCVVDETGTDIILICGLESWQDPIWDLVTSCPNGCLQGSCLQLDAVEQLPDTVPDTLLDTKEIEDVHVEELPFLDGSGEIEDFDVCVPDCADKE